MFFCYLAADEIDRRQQSGLSGGVQLCYFPSVRVRRVRAVRRQRAANRRQAHATDRRRQTIGLLGRVSTVGLDKLPDRHILHSAVALLARRPGILELEANGSVFCIITCYHTVLRARYYTPTKSNWVFKL